MTYHRQIDRGVFELAASLKGDIDDSGFVSLDDDIICLRILTESEPSNIAVSGDADGGNKLVLADVLYGFGLVAN